MLSVMTPLLEGIIIRLAAHKLDLSVLPYFVFNKSKYRGDTRHFWLIFVANKHYLSSTIICTYTPYAYTLDISLVFI